MAAIPQIPTLIDLIDNAVADAIGTPPRPHLGASQIGKECERALWYSFRWAINSNQFSGRMLRLFSRGHEEEDRFIRWMAMAGINVTNTDANGKQFNFAEPTCGGHFSGSIDGTAIGVPEAPKTWHLVEFKTHSDKSFKELCKSGVLKAKPEHFSQMQIYMKWSGLDRALYVAVNKNDDSLYCERVAFDASIADTLIVRAQRVITAQEPPARCSEDPSWYKCKFCEFHSICHGRIEVTTGALGPVALPDAHCRTCLHSTPELDGESRWSCARWSCDIPVEGQREGCGEHRYIPALIAWAAPIDASNVEGTEIVEDVLYEIVGESHQSFVNGASSPNEQVPHYPSQELKALHPLLIGNYDINELRESMGATVVDTAERALIDQPNDLGEEAFS